MVANRDERDLQLLISGKLGGPKTYPQLYDSFDTGDCRFRFARLAFGDSIPLSEQQETE